MNCWSAVCDGRRWMIQAVITYRLQQRVALQSLSHTHTHTAGGVKIAVVHWKQGRSSEKRRKAALCGRDFSDTKYLHPYAGAVAAKTQKYQRGGRIRASCSLPRTLPRGCNASYIAA